MGVTYFISDLHFGSDAEADKEALCRLECFCDELKPNEQLCILGDFFDYYLEYSAFVPKKFIEVFAILRAAIKRGVKIIYVRGNHDFFKGDFLETLGVKVYDRFYNFEKSGKKIIATHGDQIKFGKIYIVTRFILRREIFQALYKLLPSNFAFWLMKTLSQWSKKKHESKGFCDEDKEIFRKSAFNFATLGQKDVVIAGHSHFTDLAKFEDKIYANCGEWRKSPTYIVFDSNSLILKEFAGIGFCNDVVLEKMEV